MTSHRSHVSVVIPCHNAGLYIEKAVESIAGQVLPPDEIILVADSTSDDSVEKAVEKAQNSGLQIKILQCDYKNAAAARNLGSRNASGEWLAFLDADDFWFPDYLEVATRILQQSSSIVLLTHHDELVEETGRIRTARGPENLPNEERSLTHQDFYTSFVSGNTVPCPTSGMVVNRRRFEEICGFDEKQVRRHDIEMFMRLIHGDRWMFRRSAGWTYRLRSSGNISSNRPECAYYLLRAVIKNEPTYEGPEMAKFIRRQAHKALSYSLRLEDGDTYRRVCNLALSRVTLPYQLFYGLASKRPSFFSGLLNLRPRNFLRNEANE